MNDSWPKTSHLLRYLFCITIIVVGYSLPYLIQMLAKSLVIGVPEPDDLELFPEEAIMRDFANGILTPNWLDSSLLWITLFAVITGWSTTKAWGAKPAFPCQAEKFRRMCWWGFGFVVLVACVAGAWQAFSVYGDAVLFVPKLLWFFGQWHVMLFLLLLLLAAGLGLFLTFSTGLHLYTHFGVRWMAPVPIKSVGQASMWLIKQLVGQTLGLDQIAGSIGPILNEISKRTDAHE